MTEQVTFSLKSPIKDAAKEPPFIVVYGDPGIGKTTFGMQTPNPIFIDIEGSTKHYGGFDRHYITQYPVFIEALRQIRDEEHDYKTLVIETADWLETMYHKHICITAPNNSKGNKPSHISDKYHDTTNYGNGYILAANMMKDTIESYFKPIMSNRKVCIILTSHAATKPMSEPDGDDYEHRTLKLDKRFCEVLREFASAVLYAKANTLLDGQGKAIQGDRVLITGDCKAAAAKNRLYLPQEIPFRYDAFLESIGKNQFNPLNQGA